MKKIPETRLLLLLTFSMVLSFSSCINRNAEVIKRDADYIRYEVMYMDKMAGDIPTNVLPNEMHAYYTEDHVLTSITGFFGQFSLVQIADLHNKQVTSLLNFLGNKVYYKGSKGEIPAGIHPILNPVTNITQDTLSISGLLSQKAIITLPDDTYDIYFTKEINIAEPNITTPYSFIEYVLSDFRVQLSYLKMRLLIKEYTRESIDPQMFVIPEDYKEVSKEAMENIINNLFTKE